MQRKLYRKHLIHMNLPMPYYEASRQNLTPTQKECVGPYVEKFREALRDGVGVYLWGPNSVGKSWVASMLCKYANGGFSQSSYYVRMAELRDCWMDASILAQPDSEEYRCDRVLQVTFLVIDDVGREYRATSGFVESKFAELLRERASHKKATVITSNLSPQHFRELYGEGTAQLLSEITLPIQLVGPNVRSMKQEQLHEFFFGYTALEGDFKCGD